MNKTFSGSIAGAAGIALLLGGAGTFAQWNSSAAVAGTSITAGVLNDNEAGIMRAADEATDRVVKVDDFASDELSPPAKHRVAAE